MWRYQERSIQDVKFTQMLFRKSEEGQELATSGEGH